MFRPLTRLQLTVDLVGAGVFGLFALVSTAIPWANVVPRLGDDRVAFGAMVVLTTVFAAALGLRRLSPGLALAVAWSAALVQMLAGFPPIPANLAIFGVLYTTAAYGTRLVFWAGFVSALAGGVIIPLYLLVPMMLQAYASPREAIDAYAVVVATAFIASVLALLLAWTIGALARAGLRARENRRGQQRAEAVAAAEAERSAIARDMHDVVAHSLAVVIAQADGARYAAATNPAAATDALATISGAARAALADVRLLLTQLRHSQADGPQPTLADLEQLYAHVRAAGVELRVDVDPAPVADPPAAVQLAVYRILQEALTNALRHGAPTTVTVTLAWQVDHVDLDVRNRIAPIANAGAGANAGMGGAAASDPAERRGHGVVGMTERAGLVGGWLRAGPIEGGEFVVHASLPIAPIAAGTAATAATAATGTTSGTDREALA